MFDRNLIPLPLVLFVIGVTWIRLLSRLPYQWNFSLLAAALPRIYFFGVYTWIWLWKPEITQAAFWARGAILMVFGMDAMIGLASSLYHAQQQRKFREDWVRLINKSHPAEELLHHA